MVRVAGKLPVNVLAGWPAFTKRELEDLGVKRISVGGALARAAWGGFIRAAKDIADNGRFDAFADLPTMGEIAGSNPADLDVIIDAAAADTHTRRNDPALGARPS